MNNKLQNILNKFEESQVYFILKKLNLFISIILIILVLIHGIVGSTILLRVFYIDLKDISWLAFDLILIHTVFGIIFTILPILSRKNNEKLYLKENRLFWIRRISGLLMLVLLCFHFYLFGGMENGQYVLYEFNIISLIIQILLTITLFVHIISNIRPMLNSLGIINYKKKNKRIFLILLIFFILFTISAVFYYISWL
ncbi:pilus assembly protein PilX [Methanobrevibacter sp. DSM 116169]|uniref:pilus assembly protein PilX n=1 Tax=Methanobrevibacter sp. DSM 116169 TaxID=3242727 RepID=UPI0038FD03B0